MNTRSETKKIEQEKKLDIKTNDIRSRLRKNPNKIKPLYLDEYPEKKRKKKESIVSHDEKEVCWKILEILKKDEKSILFRQPAIKAFNDKEDRDYYKQQIKEPRDLGNITKKLKSIKYNAKEFRDDLDLCWSNAILFNDNETEAYKNAEYLKDLCEKLFKEYGLYDFINKENDENKNDNNSVINPENKNIDTEIKKENIEENNNNNDNNDNTNLEENNYSIEKIANQNNANKNNKITGKKRKRNYINIEEIDNIKDKESDKEKDKDKKIEKKKEFNRYGFSDIQKKFLIRHPIITCPEYIPDLLKKTFKTRKVKRKCNNKQLNKNNNINKNHIHHSNMAHLSHIQNDIKLINDKNYQRKINYDWIELFHYNKLEKNNILKEEIEIDINMDSSEYLQNNKENYKNEENFGNKINKNILNINSKKVTSEEKKQMEDFDINFNSRNVYDLDSKKDIKPSSINNDLSKSNLTNNYNLYNNIGNIKTNINENNYVSHRNNKKNDKNIALRDEGAKYFDQLSDSIMIDLLVYIENIRPQSIKELANDTIYINMELFNEETFTKVLDFVKKYV